MDETQAEIDTIESKIKIRIVNQQSTMRTNSYLDILMGVRSFNDLIRIINGLSDITNYDQQTSITLSILIDQLNSDKTELETAKAELDEDKQTIVDKQNSILALKYEAEVIEQEFQKQESDLEAEGNKIAGDIEDIQAKMKEISSAISSIATTAGWTYPVPGAVISAHTWYYNSGGIHIGEDFAAKLGSNVYAAGNGVILKSTDGCEYGYLTNKCGYPGVTGGGNQVYLLASINGGLYAIKYLHLLKGTTIAQGTVVNAGDIIGQVGSSGNSSGPHCHIEVYYLGDDSEMSKFAQNWNGDMTFGCQYGQPALNHKCEDNFTAPCRLRPESVFG